MMEIQERYVITKAKTFLLWLFLTSLGDIDNDLVDIHNSVSICEVLCGYKLNFVALFFRF